MRFKKIIRFTFPVILLVAVYFIGDRPATPKYDLTIPVLPGTPPELEEYVARKESAHRIKPDNEARIVWADSGKRKTEYSIVYLHGFSASQKEGDPVHLRFSSDFASNLYLARIADHGIDTTEALLNFTAERAWNSAREALAIGLAIGEKVILMSTSTGGTLALKLAAEFPDKVYGLINLSPNIEINDPAAFLLNDPWGLQIARLVMGGNYRKTSADKVTSKYWNNQYRLESIVQLEELIESTMTTETFRRIKQPCLTLYYYKNETEQDPQVRVDAMLRMHKKISTPDSLKIHKAIPDAGAHVIGGSLVSKDVEGVYNEIQKFAVEKLKLPKNDFLFVRVNSDIK
jgi:pimeloyl-ACP methyl ester carboxylesterase